MGCSGLTRLGESCAGNSGDAASRGTETLKSQQPRPGKDEAAENLGPVRAESLPLTSQISHRESRRNPFPSTGRLCLDPSRGP